MLGDNIIVHVRIKRVVSAQSSSSVHSALARRQEEEEKEHEDRCK